MSIIKYTYHKTNALSDEISSISKVVSNCFIEFGETPLQDFIETFTKTIQGLEFIDALHTLNNPSEILDIGVGFGQSSMYLSQKGHNVTTVEPSSDYCRFIEHFSDKYNLNLTIHECSIEAFASEKRFDACVFNASFHHCENPVLILKKCFHSLKAGGKLFLINENILKFFHTKRWFYKTLIKNPGRLGDYGGNEHVYRHGEYIRMMKQGGFAHCIEKIPLFYRDIRTVFISNCNKRENHQFKYNESQLITRFLFYYGIWRIIRSPFLTGIAKRLSLILCTYIGIKEIDNEEY